MEKGVINIGLLGLGNVGCGTVRALEENRAEIERKVGIPLSIKKI